MSEVQDNKTAVVFMADGMEMCECLLTVDILRRAGINVITASVMDRREVTSSHKVMMFSDVMAEDVDFSEADIIILPGGRVGSANLAACSIVTEQCKAFARDKSRFVAAICAAPYILEDLGILEGKKATCHPDFENRIVRGCLTHESVAVDGNIITGQGLGATMDFALCITEILCGRDKADSIAASICYKK